MRWPAIITRMLGRSPAPAAPSPSQGEGAARPRPTVAELQAAIDAGLAARLADRPSRSDSARKGVATRQPKRLDAISNRMVTFR